MRVVSLLLSIVVIAIFTMYHAMAEEVEIKPTGDQNGEKSNKKKYKKKKKEYYSEYYIITFGNRKIFIHKILFITYMKLHNNYILNNFNKKNDI